MKNASNPKVLLVGFQSFNEKMYPHTYDFLKLIGKYCDLTYYGGDDRGAAHLRIGVQLATPLNALIHPIATKDATLHYYRTNRRIRNDLNKIMKQHFDVVIAIDHSALNYVADYVEKETKLIFWSYDIITEDHVWRKSSWIRHMLKENKEQIVKCHLIMIQDDNRRKVLDETLDSYQIPSFFLPISLKYRNFPEKALQSDEGNITLMQMGTIHEIRATDKLIKYYQGTEENIRLVLHGHISPTVRAMIEGLQKKPELFPLSPQFEEMRLNIHKAHIGFIANCSNNLNDRFYSKASGQLVEFLMQGKPVITFGSEETGAFIEENKCGIYISSFNDMDRAIRKICTSYSFYSKNAKDTFFHFFDMSTYREKIREILLN